MKKVVCNYCQKTLAERYAITCDNCELVFYCGNECRKRSEEEHKDWCAHVQLYMITKSEYDEEEIALEIGGCKMKEESLLCMADALLLTYFSAACDTYPRAENITNWREYFKVRGYKINPVLCCALQWVMTTFTLIKDYFETQGTKESLKVHIVGAEKEVKYMTTFMELSNLFPGVKFDVLFVGPNVSDDDSVKTFTSDHVECSVRRGSYHEIGNLDKPDLVIGFNAGLPAYVSWMPTIQCLKEKKIPSYFTEYCWRGYHVTSLRLSILDGVKLTEGSINNFRSFLRLPDKSTKIPQFSNHIYFKLQYL